MQRLGRGLRLGDVVRISGGYQEPPPWLLARAPVEGRVEGFIPAASGPARARSYAFYRRVG